MLVGCCPPRLHDFSRTSVVSGCYRIYFHLFAVNLIGFQYMFWPIESFSSQEKLPYETRWHPTSKHFYFSWDSLVSHAMTVARSSRKDFIIDSNVSLSLILFWFYILLLILVKQCATRIPQYFYWQYPTDHKENDIKRKNVSTTTSLRHPIENTCDIGSTRFEMQSYLVINDICKKILRWLIDKAHSVLR